MKDKKKGAGKNQTRSTGLWANDKRTDKFYIFFKLKYSKKKRETKLTKWDNEGRAFLKSSNQDNNNSFNIALFDNRGEEREKEEWL